MKDYKQKIKQIAEKYLKELDKHDFSHGTTHVERVTRLALHIAQNEGGDLEVIETASLLHDIARFKELKEEIGDHALEGAKMARKQLEKIDFPVQKIDNVCYCIRVHRWSPNQKLKTIEAKILQDADRLDALGAVDVARVIASSFQTKKYKRPVFVDSEYKNPEDKSKSAWHYLVYKTKQPKRNSENFNTETGKKIAKKRQEFSKMYVERFKKEWHGII